MPVAFYLPLSPGRYEATEATAGPWDGKLQHGGPPSALLARAIEAIHPRPDLVVARVSLDILGPIPVGVIEVVARLLRPGRSVELLAAEMTTHGRPVLRATVWRIRVSPDTGTPTPALAPPPVPPETLAAADGPIVRSGYLAAIEWRYTVGSLLDPGPGAAWTRMRLPLVAGEEPSPVQRTLVVADSGSGISNVLSFRHWLFINPELTVHFTRPPQGEWIHLDAETLIDPGGVGLTRSTLSDRDGPAAAGAQSLYVAPR